MIWHIFRKDCRQLWRLGAIVAAAQMTNAALWFALGAFNEPRGLVTFAQLFSAAAVLGMAALVVAVVQQDCVPGVSQDWLIRPIRRRDLLCAKLLFVAVVVQGPAVLADVAHGMAAGFPIRDSLAAALSRSAFMLLVFDVSVLALASITSTLVQVMASLVAIWLVVMSGVFAGILARGGSPPPFASSGIQWMTPAYWSVLACSAALVVIPLQYFRRATRQSRRVVVTAVLFAPMLSLSTWGGAFAVQQRLSPNLPVAESIRIGFDDSGAGRVAATAQAGSTRSLLLPLRVSGLIPESVLMNDRADVRLIRRDGSTLYEGKTTPALGYSDDFAVRPAAGGDVFTRQRVVLPEPVYRRLSDQSVRVEIDYSLTLLRQTAVAAIAVGDAGRQVSGFGWCRAEIDDDGDEIELGCVKAGRAPRCVSVILEGPASDRGNPEQWLCEPDYAPYHVQLYPDSTGRFSLNVKARNTKGAKLILKSYRPEANVTRALVIPEMRLVE